MVWRVTIRRATETQSPSGEITTTWGDLITVWASQINLPGPERYVNPQIVGRSLSTFSIRWYPITSTITTKDRLVLDGREYDITDVRVTRQNETIQIDAFTRSEVAPSSGAASIPTQAEQTEDGSFELRE
jgi:SPP1 family predicted phage head-tail adaptor